MKKFLKRITAIFTSLCVLAGCFAGTGAYAAKTPVMVKASVETDSFVYEDTTANVTISLEGIPYSGKVMPTDVVLLVDRSGSMSEKISAMKSAVKSFVSKVNLNTHRIGIVAYDSSSVTLPLSSKSSEINAFVNTISSGGTTNIGGAIEDAVTLLGSKRRDAVGSIVLMTDGEADDSAYAMQAAEDAKALGYNFFTVALCDSEYSMANQNLKKMATSETDHYSVFETSKLSQVYNSIADKIGNCSASDLTIVQDVSSDFTVVPNSADDNIPIPAYSGNKLEWKIPVLSKGVSTLSYEVAPKSGLTLGKYTHGTGYVEYTDFDGNVQRIDLDPQTIELKLHPPQITSLSPKLYDGKTERTVTIYGKFFTPDAKLYLDKKLTAPISQSAAQITFKAPVHDDGKIKLTVENSDGQTDTETLYVGPNPTVSSVTPDQCLEGEKVTVKITGENFVGSRATMTVMFNGEKMTLTSASAKAVYATGTQKLAPGVYSITISGSNGGTVTVPNAFTVVQDLSKILSITSVTHSECNEGDSVSVKIEGTGFTGTRTGNSVYINDIKCTLTSASASCLYAKSPSSLPIGKYDVKVVNDDGRSVVKTQAFEVTEKVIPTKPAPTVTEVTPASCAEGDSVRVVIKGENFTGSRASNTVMFGDAKATLTSASKTAIYANVPASVTAKAGSYTITVINSDGQQAAAPVQFEVTEKPVPKVTITEITPAECTVGDSAKICIKGENFTGSRTGNTVNIGGVKATITSASKTALYATVPSAITAKDGSYDVEVINSDGTNAVKDGGFTVNKKIPSQPVIDEITPNSCTQGDSVKICIKGKDFTGTRTGNTVNIGGVKATITSASKTTLYATVPSAVTAKDGSYDVEVINSDGGSVKIENGFTVSKKILPQIIINSVTPASCKKGETVTIKIQGENFTGSRAANVVMIGDVKATLTSASKTCLYAKVPKTLDAGQYDIKVINSDGAEQIADVQFTVT